MTPTENAELVRRLAEALKPFASDYESRSRLSPGPDIDFWHIGGSTLTYGHLRLAHEALAAALEATASPKAAVTDAVKVPTVVRQAAEITRDDLGHHGTNYPHIRAMLSFIEALLASAEPVPATGGDA